jgi:hypothetical protein
MRYPSAAAFRRALEDRLNQQARAADQSPVRLRKGVVFQRLLARLMAVTPERWILKGAARLQRFTTVEALIDHYFDDRHYKQWPRGCYDGMVPIDPAPGTVERWIEDAIAAAGDAELFRPMVEELAFWRRSEELVAKAA